MEDYFLTEEEGIVEDVCCATCVSNAEGYCTLFDLRVNDESRCGSWASELALDLFEEKD